MITYRNFLLFTFALLFWSSANICCNAQKTIKVTAEYTYHGSANESLEHAKQVALERAKLKRIEEEFGSVVSQVNTTQMRNSNGKSESDFLSVGGSEVKGEWIETIGEPEYDDPYYENDILVIHVKVKGVIREMKAEAIDFVPRVLRNGTGDKFESDVFRSGDDMFLSFTSPVKGYLAVYLADADGQVFCLLPYRNQTTGIYPIEANRRYLFFNKKEAPEQDKAVVDEYVMTCERNSEQNMIYVVFSPNPFTKASDSSEDDMLPRELPNAQFQKWLAKCKLRDVNMNVKWMPIQLTKE